MTYFRVRAVAGEQTLRMMSTMKRFPKSLQLTQSVPIVLNLLFCEDAKTRLAEIASPAYSSMQPVWRDFPRQAWAQKKNDSIHANIHRKRRMEQPRPARWVCLLPSGRSERGVFSDPIGVGAPVSS